MQILEKSPTESGHGYMLEISIHEPDGLKGYGLEALGARDDIKLFRRAAMEYFYNVDRNGLNTGWFLQSDTETYIFIELWNINDIHLIANYRRDLIKILEAKT